MSELVVHCKKSPFDVYIGRPSKWGNPFSHLKNSIAQFHCETRKEAVEAYRVWIWLEPQTKLRQAAKIELKGKVLGCWCAPLECHGDVLAKIANSEE